jgi:hypothetical protein
MINLVISNYRETEREINNGYGFIKILWEFYLYGNDENNEKSAKKDNYSNFLYGVEKINW